MKNRLITAFLVSFSLLIIIIISWLIYAGPYKKIYMVTIDDNFIGYVQSKDIVNKKIETIKLKLLANEFQEVATKEKVNLVPVRKYGQKYLTNNELTDALEKNLTFIAKGISVDINDKSTVIVKDRSEADFILDVIKNEYTGTNTEKIYFLERVSYSSGKFPVNSFYDKQRAVNYFLNKQKLTTYKVQPGETLWDIAAKNNLAEKDLLEANPTLTPELLQIDQEIFLPRKSMLTVVTTELETDQEEIPFKTKVTWNDSIPYGQSKVMQNGIAGSKRVVYRKILHNGKEVDKVKLSEEIIKQPATKIIQRGAQRAAVSRSGRFLWPTKGYVSSRLGQRWGKMHEGIDIAASYGQVVKAVTDGKVIFSGWKSGYGLAIDIKHPNGLVTRYAHLSQKSVSTGQQVKQGQVIGQVGTTGKVTGPNLHFEVRKYGKAVDPLQFL
ncbi:peptidoglycan DD-metalloendopeptidase family protein [Desulfoscipio geothermicus]|uniref:Murein DD-endopeptidase MepM and murein hydrolase activator NlpD, contain LysM domain n=1 Tax=Desulfoscipio geothermicus DSM 3669 TaxID=1121426 RepID=A0A1I6DUM0_9FIRM|nr:M23 family metallopeptidase [Desulfoscipio geothermicus]SFR09210.1 Murein DD-endopeptidase MepM and murein hydrolase activator NlpD, contain LysM domain [Desulfoscipio geothermicus DSM 3669]